MLKQEEDLSSNRHASISLSDRATTQSSDSINNKDLFLVTLSRQASGRKRSFPMFEKEEEHQEPTSSPSGTRKQQQQQQESSVTGSKAMVDVNKSSSPSPSQTTRRYGKPPKRVSTSGDTSSSARMGGVMSSHHSHANNHNSNNNSSSRNDSVLRTVSMDGSNALMNQQTPQSTFDGTTKTNKNSVDDSNNKKKEEEAKNSVQPEKVSRTNGLVATSTKATTQEQQQEQKKLQQTATPTFSFATSSSSHAKQHVTTKKKKIVPLTLSPNAHHLTQNALFLRKYKYNNFNKSSSLSSTGVGSVNDGIREITSHTILNGALGYAKSLYPQHNLSVRDLMVGLDAWRLREVKKTKDKNKEELLLPKKLTEKAGYTKLLERSCVLYLSPGGRNLPLQQALSGGNEDDEDEESGNKKLDGWDRGDWNALAKLTFLYCAKDSFSIVEHRKKIIKEAEDQATNQGNIDSSSWLDRYDDSNLVLYQFETQYKSLPRSSSSSTSSLSSKVTNEFDLAEEIAMTTFGGSIDDGLKFGAISSLHDLAGKYVMEIESVRGRIYRYDLIKEEEEEKEELVNGENEEQQQQQQQQQKQGGLLFQGAGGRRRSSGSVNALLLGTTDQLRVSVSSVVDDDVASTTSFFNHRKDVTKMRLTLATDDKEDNDGKMLLGDNNKAGGEQEGANKPQQHQQQHCQHILKQFRTLRPPISAATSAAMSTTSSLLLPNSVNSIAIGTPSNHTLLLHHTESSNIYVNGQFVMNWGNDTQNCASHHVALFGYDLFDTTNLEGSGSGVIENYNTMKMEISRLIQEVLIDASQRDKDFCGRLLRRLIHGYDINEDSVMTTPTENSPKWEPTLQLPASVHQPCLESELMSNAKYDPVGISAKALATCFAQRYGHDAYPCLSCDVTYVTEKLGPHKVPIVVPQRTIDVLRRGGYFDIRRTEMEMIWFVEGGLNLRPEFRQEEEQTRSKLPNNNDNGSSTTSTTVKEKSSPTSDTSSPCDTIIEEAITFLHNANIMDVNFSDIVLVRNDSLIPSSSTHDPVKGKFMCRYHPTKDIYYVSDAILTMPVDNDTSATQKCSLSSNKKDNSSGEEEMTTRTMDDKNNNNKEDEDGIISDNDDMTTVRRRKRRSYMLGLYVAQEHPDGNVLVRYVLGNQQLSNM